MAFVLGSTIVLGISGCSDKSKTPKQQPRMGQSTQPRTIKPSPVIPDEVSQETPDMPVDLSNAIQQMASPNAEERKQAIAVLETYKDTRSASVLIAALGDPSGNMIRKKAYEILKDIGEPALPAFIEAIKIGEKKYPLYARRDIISLLWKLKSPQLVGPLTEVIHNDSDSNVRASAVELLAAIDEKQAFPVIQESFSDRSDNVRSKALKMLVNINASNALDTLKAAFLDESKYVRAAAAEISIEVKEASLIPQLVSALSDEFKNVRYHAAEALGAIRNPRVIEVLISAIGDKEPFVVDRAGRALYEITGQHKDFKDQRNQSLWQEWWEANKKNYPEQIKGSAFN